jgi:hypothetical protein
MRRVDQLVQRGGTDRLDCVLATIELELCLAEPDDEMSEEELI